MVEASLLGLLFVARGLLLHAELAALDGHEDVGVLGVGRNEFGYNHLLVLRGAHADGLEGARTVLFDDLELLEARARVLDQVGKERRALHGLDHVGVVGEVLHGDACARA